MIPSSPRELPEILAQKTPANRSAQQKKFHNGGPAKMKRATPLGYFLFPNQVWR
jgi:hypothetical protein